jgi:protein-arginine kinase activator protein McsA
MPSTLCDVCRERAATIFLTKVVHHHTAKHRLCERCAREHAAADGTAAASVLPLDQILMGLFQQATTISSVMDTGDDESHDPDGEQSGMEAAGYPLPFSTWATAPGEFPADEEAVDEIEEAIEEALNGLESLDRARDGVAESPAAAHPYGHPADPARAPRGIASARCPKCETTWDRLRQDGRAGCAYCYTAFSAQLSEVMERVQCSSQHAGKHPRAAEKRRRRLVHLRARRDHRLEMLERRLQASVAAEKYEEAARLRDKIKILASTIVDG